MEQWKLDQLHDQGLMPDWAYYQQSDKPMWLKFQEQKDKEYNEFLQRYEQQRQKAEQSKKKNQEVRERQQPERLLEKQAESAVEAALANLLKDFL